MVVPIQVPYRLPFVFVRVDASLVPEPLFEVDCATEVNDTEGRCLHRSGEGWFSEWAGLNDNVAFEKGAVSIFLEVETHKKRIALSSTVKA